MWKRFVNDYLSYSRKERTGIFVLLGLIVAGIIAPFLYPYLIPEKKYDLHKFDSAVAQLQIIKQDSFSNKRYYSNNNEDDNFADYTSPSSKNYYPKQAAEVFNFDPNTASAADWKRLGIRDKTIQTIQKYLSKGGHFYKPEDISKIWGLHEDDIKRLLPYVTIAETKSGFSSNKEPGFNENNKPNYAAKPLQTLDVNTADTTAFIALPGIGSKLAQRIVNFRNKLGGFYSAGQVSETFGLPDSTYQKIKPRLTLSNSSIKKININTATIDELKAHPYIRYAIANAIFQYRNQHGNFLSANDLKKIMLITDDVYKKMEPYITAGQ